MSTSEILTRLLSPSAFFEALATALVFAWIAGRLLGARKRSWRSVAAIGVAGWLAAVIVATSLVDGDLDDPSFRPFYFLLILLFTMLATVVHEVWIKPGTAWAARTPSVPHPFRAVSRRYRLSRRLAQITRIAGRHGLGGFLAIGRRPSVDTASSASLAPRIRVALEDAGGMFVKLGQLAAGRSDLLGEEAAAEFARLQDDASPAPPDAVRTLVEEELGCPFNEVFDEFDWEPIGAASIGQAHLARRIDGERVVVKVQRPGIADVVDRDLQIVARLASIAEVRTSWGADYGISALAREFSEGLRQELDYRIEAANASQIAAAISHIDRVHIPVIDRDVSTSRILVMEQLEGVPLSKVDGTAEWGADRDDLADAMLRALVEPMMNGERFHADPHPGNVFLLTDGRLGLVDFGATGRLDTFEQAAVPEIMVGLQGRDPELLREAVLSIGTLRRPVDGPALERAFARFMAKHISVGAPLSPSMLNDLLQMLAFFGILLPPSTGAMFRALVTLESTIDAVSPGYPILDAAQEIGGSLARERFSEDQLKEMAKHEAIKLAPVLRRLPRHVDRIATVVERGELTGRVSLFSTERDVAVIKELLGRAVLAFVGAACALISVLLIRTEAGPELSDGTSLLQVLGYIGLFLGTVLLLRVTIAALRDTGDGARDT